MAAEALVVGTWFLTRPRIQTVASNISRPAGWLAHETQRRRFEGTVGQESLECIFVDCGPDIKLERQGRQLHEVKGSSQGGFDLASGRRRIEFFQQAGGSCEPDPGFKRFDLERWHG